VNTQMVSVVGRQKLYQGGGIVSVTSQILVVDLLSGVLDPSTVSGMVMLHAERVTATSIEAFCVRIYRQHNKEGFLKAFSDEPERFVSGFAPLSTMLRNLFLRKPVLYPRFQVDVVKSLEGKRKAEVIELEVPMTEHMSTIQAAIMECVEASIGELKKGNTGLDMSDWNIDSALHVNFDMVVMRQLNPVWHRLHPRTKQVANDLRTLRNMLDYLLTFDAVKFLQYLDTVLAVSQPRPGSTRMNVSPWLLLDAAHTIFESARQRVYAGKINESLHINSKASNDSIRPVLEELPKWAVLFEILDEIERDVYFNPVRDDSSGAILIMCGDNGTCAQIREFLQVMQVEEAIDEDGDTSMQASASSMMKRKLRNYIHWKREFTKVGAKLTTDAHKGPDKKEQNSSADRGRAPPNKRRRMRGSASVASGPGRSDVVRTAGDKDAHLSSLMNDVEPTEAEAAHKEEIGADPMNDMDEYYELYGMNDLVVVQAYDGDLDEHIVEEVKPRYVIMYEANAAFIRRIEVYRSSHTDRNIRVYFMYYKDAVEEQRYLSSVRKEKDAFTKLIRERATMTVTIDNSKLDPEEAFLRTINTRIAGGGRISATSSKPRVVVDTREFRSSLPSLVNARGMDIIPCMLTVADYVLTPDICVERKSVSDLIGSLNNGRLFNQAETMMEHYKSPMLLIEFDQSKSFTLEPFADLTNSAAGVLAAAPDLQSKLVLLTIAFPKLRIIWSSSPYQTAEIFEELKKNNEEPDARKAASLGAQEGEEAETGRAFNQTPMDMLRELPGVDEKNIIKLSLEVGSIHELANLAEDEVCKIIGREAGRKIYRFFNQKVTDD
jgi:DNA excision repair protein ERCC-4